MREAEKITFILIIQMNNFYFFLLNENGINFKILSMLCVE